MIGRPIDGKRNGKPGYSEQRNECSKAPTLIEVGLDSTALKLIHSGLRGVTFFPVPRALAKRYSCCPMNVGEKPSAWEARSN
jgi:hypothetical protein